MRCPLCHAFADEQHADWCPRRPSTVQSAAPEAAPLENAVRILIRGGSLPRSLITKLLDEGHDITGLVRSIRPVAA